MTSSSVLTCHFIQNALFFYLFHRPKTAFMCDGGGGDDGGDGGGGNGGFGDGRDFKK